MLPSRIKETIRKIPYLKEKLILFRKKYHLVTRRIRTSPDFIIIGAQKSGTTSLFNYLIKHPQVLGSYIKETHFFCSENYNKGIDWYRSFFPSIFYKKLTEVALRSKVIVGECTPYYIFYPHAADRILKYFPKIKIIAILRNPADRAYSQYKHRKRFGNEKLSFEEAITREKEIIRVEHEKMINDNNYYSYDHKTSSCLSRGIYVNQLKTWMAKLHSSQLLILSFDDFINNTQEVMNTVCNFLEIKNIKQKSYRKFHQGNYKEMDATTKTNLSSFFKPYNQELYNLLGKNFRWDEEA